MKHRRAIALLLSLVCLAAPAHAAGFVGAYVWGGQITTDPGIQGFYDTVNLALMSGFDTIRFKIGPSQAGDYNMTTDPCASSKSLACYAGVMLASSAWDNPGLKRVMITTIDFACFNAGSGSNAGCHTASTLTANKAAIEAEYTALFAALQQRFAGRNIQFILSNWESDNFVYCGDASGYSKGGSFTTSCLAAFAATGQTGLQHVQALLQWFGYKDEAVASFIAANPGFSLVHAPEFNVYRLFSSGCGGNCNPAVMSSDSVIGQIKAAGGRAYCSFSSYDGQGGPGGTYLAAVRDILTVCQNLIIGEAGYDLTNHTTPLIASIYQALGEIRQVPGVAGVIPWNAVNPTTGTQKFGFWDAAGKQQLFPLLGPLRPTPLPSPDWR